MRVFRHIKTKKRFRNSKKYLVVSENRRIFTAATTQKQPKITAMNAQTLTPGTVVKFTPTGATFTIAKVTETRLSWFVDEYRAGTGRNRQKMVWVTIKAFQRGIDNGAYVPA